MSTSNAIKWVTYSFPTPKHPCYHVDLTIRMETAKDPSILEDDPTSPMP